MSIREKLQDTASYLRSTRKAILGRGGEIAENAGLKEIADAVYKIPADTSLVYQTDDSVAYHKIVPTNAEEYAQVERVGGMTYKIEHGNNYITDLFIFSDDTSSAVINADGSITITNSDGGWYYAEIGFDSSAFSGKYFTAIGDTSGIDNLSIATQYWDEEENVQDSHSGWNMYIPEDEESRGYFEIYLKGVAGTFTFKPLIVDSPEDAKPRLIDTDVEALESIGANLLDISQALNKNLVDNGDGTYTFTRTSDDWTGRFSADINTHIPAGVTVSIKATSLSSKAVTIGFYDADGNSVGDTVSTNGNLWIRTFEKDVKKLKMYLQLASAVGTYAKFSELQINYGSTAAPYKPYKAEAVDTLTISAELRAFLEDKGYGRGVEGYPNYIDFERKVFVPNTYRKVFDGTENWKVLGTSESNVYRNFVYVETLPISIDANTISPMVCNMYNAGSQADTYYAKNRMCDTHPQGLHFYDDAYNTSDISLWKAHLAELYASGNPLIVEYALAEPIEVDISAYLKDGIVFLQVEGGGTITAVNEREQAVPSTIKYMTKVGN